MEIKKDKRLLKRNNGSRIILTLLLLLLFNGTVQAQAVGLSILPAESSLYLNGSNTASVNLYVTDAVDLIAFDLSLTYDPQLLHLDSWTHGGFLGTSLFPLVNINQPGYLHLAFAKMGSPGGSGSGNLINLNFSGLGYGTSPVTITSAVFSDGAGNNSYPVLNNGTINCIYASNLVVYRTLTGEISLQGQSVRGGIPVTLNTGLFVGQGPYTAVSLAQPGTNLFFNSVAMDAYPVTTAYPYYLNLDVGANKIKGLAGTSNVLSPLLLLAGNVSNSDNEINTKDLDLIKTWFDLTAADLKPDDELLGDANNDGVVDVRDLALAGGNFGLNGATAYQDWLP